MANLDAPSLIGPNTGEQTLLDALQGIQSIRSQPLIPDNPLAQLGSILAGFGAGVQGKPNPVTEMYRQQRQDQLVGFKEQAGIGQALGSIEDRRAQREFEAQKVRREEAKTEQGRADKALELRQKVGLDLIKMEGPARKRGFKELQSLGYGITDQDIDEMSEDSTYGFGKGTVGDQAKAIYLERLQAGTPIPRSEAFKLAKQSDKDKTSIQEVAADYRARGMSSAQATLAAERDVADAKLSPPRTLEARYVQLITEGKIAEAQSVLNDIKRIAEAKSTKVIMPRQLDPRFVSEAQDLRYRAREWTSVLNQFDPGFVGVVGRLKGLSNKFSDFPGIPMFKGREKFVARLLELTQEIKKERIGSARTSAELSDLARSLPDPEEGLSVPQFASRLESYLEGYINFLHTFPEDLKMAGYENPVSFNKEIEDLRGALKMLNPITASFHISPQEYESLQQKGFTPDDIRRQGFKVRGR